MGDNPTEQRFPGSPDPAVAAPTRAPSIQLVPLVQLVLLVVFTIYLARSIVVPVVFAVLIKLALQPSVRMLERLRIPRPIGAIIVLAACVLSVLTIVSMIGAPTIAWASGLPNAISQLQQQAHAFSGPITVATNFLGTLESLTRLANTPGVIVAASPSPQLSEVLLTGTAGVAGACFITLIMTFFLLVFGDVFLRRLVEVLPRFRDKRRAVEIAVHVEADIGRYLLTVTVLNVAVGTLTGLMIWIAGLGSPIMWGAIATVLNFIPTLGAVVCAGALLLAGLLSLHPLWHAVLPVCAYLPVHIIEAQFVTPLLLARRFMLNPVLVIASVLFWFWLWGVPGAVLAVPLLAIMKIICDRSPPLAPIGHMLSA